MSDVGFASPIVPLTKNGQLAQHGSDDGLVVRFYKERVHQAFESERQGRPVFLIEDHVHIIIPGGKTDIKRKVDLHGKPTLNVPPDPERWPRQWAAFQNQQEQAQAGTPLEEWPPLRRELVEDFKAARVHTVEALATIHDGNAGAGMPLEWRKYRDMAVKWLADAADKAPIIALQSENERLRADIEMLKQNMLANSEVRRGGRPKGSKNKPKLSEGEIA